LILLRQPVLPEKKTKSPVILTRIYLHAFTCNVSNKDVCFVIK